MRKHIVGVKQSAGITYSPREEKTVERINICSKQAHAANLEIGKAVHGLVEAKGGVQYGDSTLDRLARHPGLLCSREHIRRCWQYYRLTAQYGEEIMKIAPGFSYSHLYQLSRLLDIEDEQERKTAILAFARKGAEEGMSVTDLRAAVSTHLQSLPGSLRGKPKREETEKDSKDDGMTGTIYEELLDTTETIVLVAAKLVKADALGKVAEVRRATNRLGCAYVQLVERLAQGDEEAVADARSVIVALTKAIGTAPRKEA